MSSSEWTGYTTNAEVRAKHHRSVLLFVVAPVVAVAVVMLIVLILMIANMSPRAFNVAAAFMSLLILVPTVILCLIPYVALVAIAAGSRKVYLLLPPILESAHTITHKVNMGSQRVSRIVAEPVIVISQRLAWAERMLGGEPYSETTPMTQVPMLPARTNKHES